MEANNGTLSYEEFAKLIQEQIRDHLPRKYKDAEITIKSIRKENGVVQRGLNITHPEDIGSPVPMIYLEHAYKQYVQGKDVEEILNELAEVFTDHLHPQNFDIEISDITDFDKVRDRILPKVVQASANQELAAERPSTPVADLMTIYRIQVSSEASIPINNQIMNNWGVTPQLLHEIALENMKRMDPPTIQSMTEILMESMGGMDMLGVELPDPKDDPMRVISTKSKHLGAAALLDTEFMESIDGISDEASYILPSSTHELILVSANDMDVAQLTQMVNEVNENEVDISDRLSDGVYRYNMEIHGIERVEPNQTQTQSATHGHKQPLEMEMSMAM